MQPKKDPSLFQLRCGHIKPALNSYFRNLVLSVGSEYAAYSSFSPLVKPDACSRSAASPVCLLFLAI